MRDRFGVELLCRVLRPAVRGFLSARGYRAAKARMPSARPLRYGLLVPEVARLHAHNYGVYGRRQIHALMRRQGWQVGRGPNRLIANEGVAASSASWAWGEVEVSQDGKFSYCPAEVSPGAPRGLIRHRLVRPCVSCRTPTRRQGRLITCNAASARTDRTNSGWSTSPMFRRGRGWRSPRSSPTTTHVESWDGGP